MSVATASFVYTDTLDIKHYSKSVIPGQFTAQEGREESHEVFLSMKVKLNITCIYLAILMH